MLLFIYLFKPFFFFVVSLLCIPNLLIFPISCLYLCDTYPPKKKFKYIAKKKKRKEKKNRGMGIAVWPIESHSVSLLVFIAMDYWSGSRPLASATL